jgi:hypothetical protein
MPDKNFICSAANGGRLYTDVLCILLRRCRLLSAIHLEVSFSISLLISVFKGTVEFMMIKFRAWEKVSAKMRTKCGFFTHPDPATATRIAKEAKTRWRRTACACSARSKCLHQGPRYCQLKSSWRNQLITHSFSEKAWRSAVSRDQESLFSRPG